MHNTSSTILPLIFVVLGAACSKSVPPADAWAGRWNGAEGTYLEIEGSNGVYQVTIKDLDSARSFHGSATGSGIEFQRGGAKETISATDGKGTGMKWLVDKHDCLAMKAGEGYCRD